MGPGAYDNDHVTSWGPPSAADRIVVAPSQPAGAPGNGRVRRAKRPPFVGVVAALIAFRLGRDVVFQSAARGYGLVGIVVVVALGLGTIVVWRARQRRITARQGGEELSGEQIRQQIVDSGLAAPAFAEDGTLLGASIVVVNQRTKLLEINTAYDLYGSAGQRLGRITQIGQSRGKQAARLFTAFDQFFTHHLKISDLNGAPLLRLTRPRKIFLTKVHVFDGSNRFLGTIKQRNVFGRIRFDLVDAQHQVVGSLRATHLKAWDFVVRDTREVELATLVKSWEGWARTALTRSDRYVVRVHAPLPDPIRSLTVAAALSVDLALKQDARSFG